MSVDMKSHVVPAMIKSWIDEMMNKKEQPTTRDNRYMMLEYTHRVIGQALHQYESRK